MKKIAKFLGGGPDSDEQMMKVYEFETKVAMVSNDLSMTNIVEVSVIKFNCRKSSGVFGSSLYEVGAQ